MIEINTYIYYVILIAAVILLIAQFTVPIAIRRRKAEAINNILNDMLVDLLDKFEMQVITHIEMGECRQKMISRLQAEGLLKYMGDIYVRKDNDEICASYNIDSTFYFVIISDSDATSQSL